MAQILSRSRWLVKTIIGATVLAACMTVGTTAYATGTGVLEICKTASGPGVTGSFDFTVSGVTGTTTVPVGGCSKPITVTAGDVVVTEVARSGFVVADITAAPADRLVSRDLANRTAKVKVPVGTVANQTIVTFSNKVEPPKNGTVKVCKAAEGVPAGQEFSFKVGTTTTTARAGSCSLPVTVPAGTVAVTEAATSDYAVTAITSAPPGTLVSSNIPAQTATVKVVGGAVTEVTFTNARKTGTVKVCKVAGPGVTAGQEFTFIVGTTKTTAKAGSCSAPLTLPVGNVTITEQVPASYEVTAIAVSGAGSLVSRDLPKATAVVGVAVGTTEVTFTNKKINRPPVCTTVTASPGEIWPPNHKFVTVTLSGATDPDGGATTLEITGVTQDEALNGTGDGNTAPDAAWVSGRRDQVQVRAERSGQGDGRVYRIGFTVSDGHATCSGTVSVGVPHDQSGDPAVDTTSVVVNSFGP